MIRSGDDGLRLLLFLYGVLHHPLDTRMAGVIRAVVATYAGLSVLVTTFRGVFYRGVTTTFIIRSSVRSVFFLTYVGLAMYVGKGSQFISRLVSLFAITFTRKSNGGTVCVPTRSRLRCLVYVLYKVRRRVVSRLLRMFLSGASSLSVGEVSSSEVPRIFVVVSRGYSRLKFFFVRGSRSRFLSVSRFPSGVLSLLGVNEECFFYFSVCSVKGDYYARTYSLYSFLGHYRCLSSESVSIQGPLR